MTVSHLRAVEAMAEQLLAEHAPSWSFGWDHAKMRAGVTHYDRHRITLSKPLMSGWTLEAATETMLHEIAHVLAGPLVGHGPAWAAQCRKLGIKPLRCVTVGGPERPLAPMPWVGTCPGGHAHGRTRKPTDRPQSCGACKPYYSPQHLITWTRRSA